MLLTFFFASAFHERRPASQGTLKSLKVDEIQVSIDGLEQARQPRGSGTTRSMTALKDALNAGFDVSVSTMVHRGNLCDFDRMERLYKDMGIKDWTVDIPCVTGRLRDNAEFSVNFEEGGKYLGYGYGGGLHSSAEGYGCGLHLMSVMADGKTAKCTFYRDRPVATIDQGLMTAWQKVRPVLLKTLSCNCEYVEVCREAAATGPSLSMERTERTCTGAPVWYNLQAVEKLIYAG
jgi:MoaA/NifB/PqqE/SkfB family radical SAM enzyme